MAKTKTAYNFYAISLIWRMAYQFMRNIGQMDASPVVVIPTRSPLLESVALAVLGGASDQDGGVPGPLVVADPTHGLGASSDAPILFVGWRGDLEESRRRASEILTALARRPPIPHPVALFEAHLGEPVVASAASVTAFPEQCSGLRFIVPPERFVIRPGPGSDSSGPIELARARQWGARTYSVWRSTMSHPPAETQRPRPIATTAKWMGWCGAME